MPAGPHTDEEMQAMVPVRTNPSTENCNWESLDSLAKTTQEKWWKVWKPALWKSDVTRTQRLEWLEWLDSLPGKDHCRMRCASEGAPHRRGDSQSRPQAQMQRCWCSVARLAGSHEKGFQDTWCKGWTNFNMSAGKGLLTFFKRQAFTAHEYKTMQWCLVVSQAPSESDGCSTNPEVVNWNAQGAAGCFRVNYQQDPFPNQELSNQQLNFLIISK